MIHFSFLFFQLSLFLLTHVPAHMQTCSEVNVQHMALGILHSHSRDLILASHVHHFLCPKVLVFSASSRNARRRSISEMPVGHFNGRPMHPHPHPCDGGKETRMHRGRTQRDRNACGSRTTMGHSRSSVIVEQCSNKPVYKERVLIVQKPQEAQPVQLSQVNSHVDA